ncbi:MAG: D-aminoacyl-tRNA deacylase [Candidatus Micrarchaeia archaeon]|jgi:D-aminoacyl-tRNA deacylase
MPTLIYSKINTASKNICEYIINKYNFEKTNENEWGKNIQNIEVKIVKVEENVIDFSFKDESDYLIVPSTHKSTSNTKTLGVHVPGNWSTADLGGKKETLNMCYSSKMKTILLNINKLAEERGLIKIEKERGWEITLEVDHHGPTPPEINEKTPIMFVEIGSTEEEWNDKEAVELIGDAIINSIPDNTKYPTVLGFGGGHYASKFNKYELNDGEYKKLNYAISHILPKYRFDDFEKSAEEMFKQVLNKNVEKIEKVLIDWKGLKSDQRQLIVDLCERNDIKWEKV